MENRQRMSFRMSAFQLSIRQIRAIRGQDDAEYIALSSMPFRIAYRHGFHVYCYHQEGR